MNFKQKKYTLINWLRQRKNTSKGFYKTTRVRGIRNFRPILCLFGLEAAAHVHH